MRATMNTWRRACSSYNNCVEAHGPFTKSTRSGYNGNCVEVAGCECGGDVLVRDSKDPDGPVLAFDRDVFATFLAGIKAGEFDMDG